MKKTIVALVAVLALSGCAQKSADGNSVEGGDNLGVVTNIYNGKPLYCLEEGHGLTCDWVRYHHEFGFEAK